MYRKLCWLVLIAAFAATGGLAQGEDIAERGIPDVSDSAVNQNPQSVRSEIEKGDVTAEVAGTSSPNRDQGISARASTGDDPKEGWGKLYWWIALFSFIAVLTLINSVADLIKRRGNKKALSEAIKAMIDGGIKMEPGMHLTPDMLTYSKPGDQKNPDLEALDRFKNNDLRKGIIWSAIGVGIFLSNLLNHFLLHVSLSPMWWFWWPAGLIPLSIGMGYLIIWKIEKQSLSPRPGARNGRQ